MTLIPVLGVVLATSVLYPPEDAVKKELAQLQGKWKIVKIQTEGCDRAFLKSVTFEFQGDRLIQTFQSGSQNFTVSDPIQINPTKIPKTMDFPFINYWPRVTLYVYKLDGDTLRIHRSNDIQKRPGDMTYKKDETSLWTLERVK